MTLFLIQCRQALQVINVLVLRSAGRPAGSLQPGVEQQALEGRAAQDPLGEAPLHKVPAVWRGDDPGYHMNTWTCDRLRGFMLFM